MSSGRRRLFLTLLSALAAATGARAQTPLTTVRVLSGLNSPVDIQAPPDRTDRLFIVQQGGQIRVYDTLRARLRPDPYLDLSKKTRASGEQGLLGLAFDPAYLQSGWCFVNYTDLGGDTVVERYTVSATDPNKADPTSASLVLTQKQPFSNHNAGQLQFGPDGYLYLGFGDGGSAGDPGCRAQDPTTFLGKMLRLDVSGASGYTVPPSNPFVTDPNVLDEIWALGLRNPWRYSFDRDTGDLWIADVGQSNLEEVDWQPAVSPGGENYGWKIMEGTSCYSNAACDPNTPPCNDPTYTLPIHEYGHTEGNCSITGGYVYRGCAIPDLQGSYFFADYCSNRIWSLRFNGTKVTDLQNRTKELDPGGGLSIDSISSFGEDRCGELYIADLGGEIYKIVPAVPPPATDLGFGKVGANGLVPELALCGLLDAGNFADLTLRFAPPNSTVFLWVSTVVTPTPVWGGTLVPLPPIAVLPYTSDANGEWKTRVPGGLGSFFLSLQFVLRDPGVSFNTGFSNALWVEFK